MAEVTPLTNKELLIGRINLALSLVNHRPWCPECHPHVQEIEDALRGVPIDQIDRLDRRGRRFR